LAGVAHFDFDGDGVTEVFCAHHWWLIAY